MATNPEDILRRLGLKMLAEIDMLLNRNAEERAKLLNAPTRLQELAAEDAVLHSERARLIARGQPDGRSQENESRLVVPPDHSR